MINLSKEEANIYIIIIHFIAPGLGDIIFAGKERHDKIDPKVVSFPTEFNNIVVQKLRQWVPQIFFLRIKYIR